jgi:BlaI family transcriptional regulator, penicillinase repressor
MTSMTQDDELRGLSRRERQIMDLLFQRGKASVGEVMDGIPDPPGYSAVRATLRTLEQKGRVTHEEEGRAYIYRPTLRRDAARKSALTHVLKTFFDNSAEQAVAALLELKGPRLSDAQLERMSRLVENAKKEGR